MMARDGFPFQTFTFRLAVTSRRSTVRLSETSTCICLEKFNENAAAWADLSVSLKYPPRLRADTIVVVISPDDSNIDNHA